MLYTPFSKYISSHLDTNESTSYSTVSRWRGRSLDPGAADTDTEDVIEAAEETERKGRHPDEFGGHNPN